VAMPFGVVVTSSPPSASAASARPAVDLQGTADQGLYLDRNPASAVRSTASCPPGIPECPVAARPR
jgi:hypothetical protein